MKYLAFIFTWWLAACAADNPQIRSDAPSAGGGSCWKNPLTQQERCTNGQGKKAEPWQISPNQPR